MQASTCPRCGQLLFFDNSVCLGCGAELGFVPERLELVLTGPGHRRCLNATIAACNWLVTDDDPEPLCLSCRLTRTRPNDADLSAMEAFRLAEAAKRRLLAQVLGLGLPIAGRAADPEAGLAFDLLSSRNQDVMTGHDDGVITLDLSESDAVHREFVRLQMGEPYRTVLGHLRHEIGHYFWPRLHRSEAELTEFRSLFGDERLAYDTALERHYRDGPPADWARRHVSAYATMHPWEDWAETFAHFLHIEAGIATAASFGMRVGEPSLAAARRSMGSGAPAGEAGVMIEQWLALTFAMNAVAQTLGQEALYPFVLAPAVMRKLEFVRGRIASVQNVSATPNAAPGAQPPPTGPALAHGSR